MITGIMSCSSEEKDPLSYYQEIDLNAAPNTLSKKEKKNGWQLLFDGENIDGWRGYNMDSFPDCWKIDGGAFTMTTEGKGESQDIITNDIYENFAFSTEVKFSHGSNSGLIYQVKEDPKYKFPYETGPEFQIIDHENWHTPLEDWQIMGANYAMYPPKVKSFKDIGEWNHLLIVVRGNKVTQILNGEIVVEYEKYSDDWMQRRNSGKWERFPDWGKFDKGHIALQNHGSDVWFRNIKIKNLS